jgi:hypothetical protein
MGDDDDWNIFIDWMYWIKIFVFFTRYMVGNG